MRRLSRQVLCIFLLGICSCKILRSADTPISFENTTYEFCADCNAPQVRLLVTQTSKAALNPKEKPVVAQVLMGGQRDDGLARCFNADWIALGSTSPQKTAALSHPPSRANQGLRPVSGPAGSNKNGAPGTGAPAIDLSFNCSQSLLAGTYDLYLKLQPVSQPNAPYSRITLTRPSPKLFAYPKMFVSRTRWIPFLDGFAREEKSPQVLDETSRKSGAHNLKIRLAAPATQGAEFSTGSLSFTDLPKDIAAGAHIDSLDYGLTGAFALGATAGTLKVFADESTEPLASFDFEVHDKVARFYLWVTLLCGLVASWLVKVKVQQSIEWDQAYLDASAFLKRVEKEASRHSDNEFKEDYARELSDFKQAMAGKSVATLNTAKLALDEAWKKALENLAKRREPAVQAYQQLDEVLRLAERLNLPVDVLHVATSLQQKWSATKADLDRDDFDKVKQTGRETIQGLAAGLSSYASGWQPQEKQCVEILQKVTVGLSKQLAKEAAGSSVAILAALDKVSHFGVIDSSEQLKQAALDLAAARDAVTAFYTNVAMNQKIDLVNAQDQIARAHRPSWKQAPFDEVGTKSEQLEGCLQSMAEAPDPTELAHKLNAVHAAWTYALDEQLKPPPAGLQALLDAAKYRDALTLVLNVLGNPKPSGPITSIAQVAGALLPVDPATPSEFSWRSLIPGRELTILRLNEGRQAEFESALPTPFTVERQLMLNKLWQTLGVGAIAVIGGYGLFSGAWVGTFTDFSNAFFWAFGLDLTFDAVLKVIRKA